MTRRSSSRSANEQLLWANSFRTGQQKDWSIGPYPYLYAAFNAGIYWKENEHHTALQPAGSASAERPAAAALPSGRLKKKKGQTRPTIVAALAVHPWEVRDPCAWSEQVTGTTCKTM